MRPLSELHKKHCGEIWVVGSDPTLEGYPDDFLDGKISMTLHLANLKFPNATYRYFNELDRIKYLMIENPKIVDQMNIFGWPFYNKTEEMCKEAVGEPKNTWYLSRHSYPPYGDPTSIFMAEGYDAMKKLVRVAKKAESNTFGGHGTCLHPAMYAAILMGGNPINIIGCNFSSVDGKEHFGDMHDVDSKMRPRTPSFTGYRGDRMTRGLEAIIAGCKDLGIQVNWIKEYEK